MKRILSVLMFVAFVSNTVIAQDPHFTQFYSAPLTVNPAYTGVFKGDIRLMSNYRRQWMSSNAPYTTTTVAMDGKIGIKQNDGLNTLNYGAMFMNDNSLNGAFKSNYISATGSYHAVLDVEQHHSFGGGLMATYGNRTANFSNISFGNQFTSGGFDLSIPSGEIALNSMKPFISIAAGLLYQYNNDETSTYIDFGVSAFHINKPKQSFLNDELQYLPMRYSVQASYMKYLGNEDEGLIHIKALYQQQAAINYFMAGFLLEKFFGEEKQNGFGAGLWYRYKDSFSPYIRIGLRQFFVGLSYDITTSTLKNGLKPANSMELSLKYVIAAKEK